MALAYPPTIFNDMLDFLISAPSPQAIIAYKPSAAMQTRLEDLLDKNAADALTADEQAKLEQFLQLDHLMNMLKIRARKQFVDVDTP